VKIPINLLSSFKLLRLNEDYDKAFLHLNELQYTRTYSIARISIFFFA